MELFLNDETICMTNSEPHFCDNEFMCYILYEFHYFTIIFLLYIVPVILIKLFYDI
jgi:hypothetical protein